MPSLQAAASVGQSALATAYAEAFAAHGIVTSTVLLTRRDTADRHAYLHARNTLLRLLEPVSYTHLRMASLMMSAALPCMGWLMAVRSPKPRVLPLAARSSGIWRFRPNMV